MNRLLCVLIVTCSCAVSAASENLLVNGDFENGKRGWTKPWSRVAGVKAALDEQVRHDGKTAVRIQHGNPQDWSLSQEKRLEAKSGEIYELSGWLRTRGEGQVSLSVTLYDAKKEAVDWSFGGGDVRGDSDWRQVESRFAKSYQVATPVARATGYSEMLSHTWLNSDHSVQQTRFADGVEVTVNFGDEAYRMADGTSLAPMSRSVKGLRSEK